MSNEGLKDFHYLILVPSVDMRIDVLVNGFPLVRQNVTAGSEWQAMLDIHNVGGANQLEVTGVSLPGSVGTLDVRLRAYSEIMVVTLEDGIDLPITLGEDVPERTPEGILHLPIDEISGRLTASLTYAQLSGPTFPEVYLGDETISEELSERGARSILRSFGDGDLSKFIMSFWARNADFAKVYGETVEQSEAAFTALVEDGIVAGLPKGYADKPVEITMWAGGRLAEVTVVDDLLIRSNKDANDEVTELSVFLGIRDGHPSVVR